MRMLQRFLAILSILSSVAVAASAQELAPYAYDLGSPSVVDYYVDPLNGSDTRSGTSVAAAWRTVQHAWSEIPESATLAHGYRINLLNGMYGSDNLPNYWENRNGTADHPIILTALQGHTSVRFTRDINMAHTSYFYLIGVNITPQGGGDAFHCEACDHLLLRGCTFNGGSIVDGAHETVKINQSQYVYLENNEILYADDNAIDFVAVQYGHVIGNRIHDAADWCMYAKGGSAYLRIEANQIFNCGTGGFTAGQGSGFQFMTSPWLHYEAYDIKFINNLVHDIEGAAFGVNGGYNIFIAHNTAFNVGSRDHLIEVVFGERTCDGESDGDTDASCAAHNGAGGWGPQSVHTSAEPVGNRNVSILNNIVYNPTGSGAAQHFAIYGPRSASSGMNLDSTQYSDSNLIIKGNLIWNSPGTAILGIEDSEQGCQSANPTCNEPQLLSENFINVGEPQLNAPGSQDFRPQPGSNIFTLSPAALSSFSGGDRPGPPSSAAGVLENELSRDFSGAEAAGVRYIGAFDSVDASLTPPQIDGQTLPDNPTSGTAPAISKVRVSGKRSGRKYILTVNARLSGAGIPGLIAAAVEQRNRSLGSITLAGSNANYRGKRKFSIKSGKKIKITVTAINDAGTSSKRASITP